MFIIFGSPRSGTTLLSACLDLHDQIIVPGETDFIIPVAFVLDRIRDPALGRPLVADFITRTERFKRSLGEFLSVEEVRGIVHAADYNWGSILTGLYGALAGKRGKLLAGDKSPNDLLHVSVLGKTSLLRSGIKVVHIVRDIRDVVLSLRKVEWRVDWKDDIESFFPRLWADSNLLLPTFYRERGDLYMRVRYEDLVLNPGTVLRQVTDFLGVPFQEKMMSAEGRGARYQHLPHHKNIGKPFLKERLFLWRSEMPRRMRRMCEDQASEALRFFGYELEYDGWRKSLWEAVRAVFKSGENGPRPDTMADIRMLQAEARVRELEDGLRQREVPLEITDFGPDGVTASRPFNVQPGGASALWIKSRNATADTQVMLNGELLTSCVQEGGGLVTAAVPESLYRVPGRHPLVLLDTKTRRISNLVRWTVK